MKATATWQKTEIKSFNPKKARDGGGGAILAPSLWFFQKCVFER